MAKSTEATPAETPVEKLDAPMRVGLDPEAVRRLGEPLNQARVQSRQGMSYLATHDCIRVANQIFGFGKWGHEVVELSFLGETPVESRDKTKQGFHLGYRCTVRLTVEGCVPTSGVGYGDATEYQQTAKITAHELAAKEAESDALKRALKNYGDQFGLILYAKEHEQRRIAAEEAENALVPIGDDDRAATDDEVAALLDMAKDAGAETLLRVEGAVAAHRAKIEGHVVSAAWLTRATERLLETQKVRDEQTKNDGETATDFTPPAAATAATSGDDVAAAFGEAA